MTEDVLDQLTASQSLVIAMTRLVVDDDSARVGAWNVRDIAAHLAATERECYEPRIHAMADGQRPIFDWYSNEDRDFDGITLDAALDDWLESRARLLDYVRGLTSPERDGVGVHNTFGELNVEGYLRVALDHDRDHLRALERLAGELTR